MKACVKVILKTESVFMAREGIREAVEGGGCFLKIFLWKNILINSDFFEALQLVGMQFVQGG